MSSGGFKVRQAPDRIPSGRLMLVAAISMFIGGVCVVVSGLIQSCETRRQRQGVESYPAPRPPGTVEWTLVGTTSRGLDQVAVQKRTLDSYGWVDRAHGIARLPIDRAIDLIVLGAQSPQPERSP